MCRSIKTLRRPEEPAQPDEIEAAALQFVRKISGYRKPSRMNEEAFDSAVADVAAASQRLLEAIGTRGRAADQMETGRRFGAPAGTGTPRELTARSG